MAERSLSVAVVGDPHFCVETSEGRGEVSYIRLAPNGDFLNKTNPWLALKEYITDQNLSVDILLCVGDITVCADKTGLESAWKELLNLGQLLGVSHVISATGNHDVQSRAEAKAIGEDPIRALSKTTGGLVEPLKNLTPTYPIVVMQGKEVSGCEELQTAYFGNNVAIVEATNYRVAVLNSCCEHWPEPHRYDRGSFPKSTQRRLVKALEAATERKINIFLCHHSPSVHNDEYDFIQNGESLLRCLEHHGSWLLIHGHKHHGRISYAQGSNTAPVIFSASSLGYCLDLRKTGARNQFYILDLVQCEQGGLRGQTRAWNWHVGQGWTSATPRNVGINGEIKGGIYNGCGFGHRCDLNDIAFQIANVTKSLPHKWIDVIKSIPELHYLTPCDMEVLAMRLTLHNIVVERDDNGNWDELVKKNS